MSADIYDVIIIGGGPAGMTAGIYTARKKLSTLLISRDFIGQIGKAPLVENYPGIDEISGLELIKVMRKQIEKFGVIIKEGVGVKGIKKRKDDIFEIEVDSKEVYSAKTVIIASGRDPRPLEVPGEKEFIGKGVSYCVTCDGPLFSGKEVVVIGGGNSGFCAAIELTKYCSKVYILESSPNIRADEANIDVAKKTGKVEIIINAAPKEIKGKGLVESIVYEDKKEGKINELPIKGVFIEIGSIPATGFVKDLVNFNKEDEIKTDIRTCVTKTPGLFAAGDVVDNDYKQIVIAAGEGAKAALSTYEYLREQ